MKKIHYISGTVIGFFVAIHLFNHLCSIFGAEAHIQVMQTLRIWYRNILFESILFVAIGVQIISGLTLFRASYNKAVGFYKLKIWTGLYLAFFFLVHSTAVIAGRYILQLDTNFYFGVAGLNTFPYNLFFVPYYGLAIMAFFGHIASIHSSRMKRPVVGIKPKSQSAIIVALGFVLMLFIFYGLTNRFKGVPIPQEYHIMIGK